MQRIIIVSNRLPISTIKKGKTIRFVQSAGGLATGLRSIIGRSKKNLWIGWPGIALEKLSDGEKEKITHYLVHEKCYPVFLRQREVEDFYEGFCNKTIWPLFHYFIQYTRYEKDLWNSYVRVNSIFCDAVMDVTKPNDLIWVHDYHLLLLPQMLRERLPNATIGFFLHIPFPSFEVFRLLPWHREILDGLLGADLLGFHTYDYVRHFLSSIRRRLGYDISLDQITVGNRIIKVETHPMGIDYDRFAGAVSLPEVQQEIDKVRERIFGRKVIISVDRLDYTKGILNRLESYDLFLQKYPHFKEKVLLILVAVPSREGVEHYKALKHDLDERIGRINGKYGTFNWVPVWYMYTSLPFHTLTALYAIADVALVTPVRDGMNLIAKEYVATKNEVSGVLILSEMAGAAKELSEAIIVNPNNIDRTTEAIELALTMPEDEKIERLRDMQRRLQRYDITLWANNFINELKSIKKVQKELLASKLTPVVETRLLHDYAKSTRRMILLDYDGTLRPFEPRPSQAVPGEKLLNLLGRLTSDPRNDVLIISGRNRETLEKWFDGYVTGLIAEHGVWIRDKKGPWEMIDTLFNQWKEQIRPLMESFMDRTPGSRIEEKEYSLAWHYRTSDPEQAFLSALELKEALIDLTTNLGIGVLEGNKVIEVKNIEVNKGRAALKWVKRGKYDFIISIGDDCTDEDIFSVLNKKAYTIKVGISFTKARFKVNSYIEVLALLKKLAGGIDEYAR